MRRSTGMCESRPGLFEDVSRLEAAPTACVRPCDNAAPAHRCARGMCTSLYKKIAPPKRGYLHFNLAPYYSPKLKRAFS